MLKNKDGNSRHLTSAEAKQYIEKNGGYIRKPEGISWKVLYDRDDQPICYVDVITNPRPKPMTRQEAVTMINGQLARAKKLKAQWAAEEKAAIEENRKKILSPESLKALAEAVRKHPNFGAPQWHEGRWVWVSPHGDSKSRCGSPIPPPENPAPHQKLLWAKCRHCGIRRPWGGCSGRGVGSRRGVW